MPPLVRPGRVPLHRLSRLLSSSSSPFPYTISSGGGGGDSNLSPLLLLTSHRPSPFRVYNSTPAARTAGGGQRGLSFCSRALDTEEGSSGSASSDLSAPYLSVRIRCRKQDADALSEALLCFGASSVTVDDIADAGDLDEICITSIFTDGEEVDACVSNAVSSIGLDYRPVHETSIGKHCDWVAIVQEAYDSTKVIDGLWVIPKWRTPPDPQATNITINPGLAFGTGEHPTTKLCLLMLRGIIKGGERVLDYGTGTGVLGIAALKLGAALSTGIDIDPQAVTSARENILLNGIESNKMPVYLVPTDAQPSCISSSIDKSEEKKPTSNPLLDSSRRTYDIVAANILLNPLLEMVEDIVGYAKLGGIVGVSGIISEQVPKIKEVYSMYLDNISVSEMDGWACLHGTKRA